MMALFSLWSKLCAILQFSLWDRKNDVVIREMRKRKEDLHQTIGMGSYLVCDVQGYVAIRLFLILVIVQE